MKKRAYSHLSEHMLLYRNRKFDGAVLSEMTYKDSFKIDVTLVANEFIDTYMPKANGDYVKVYLYMLRNGRKQIEVSQVADALELTEGDVRRAIRYWQELGIFKDRERDRAADSLPSESTSLKEGPSVKAGSAVKAAASGEPMERASAEAGPSDDASELRSRYRRASGRSVLDRLHSDAEFSQLLFVVQKYMSRILTNNDQQVFAYLYDGLHLPCDVIDYLVDYCVQQGKDKIKYIEAVGLDWASSGIRDVEAARKRTRQFDEAVSEKSRRTVRRQAVKGQSRGTDYDSIVMDKVIGRKQG